MVAAGFRKIYIGFESASADWQRQSGDKVASEELAAAVEALAAAGASRGDIAAYILLGHPRGELQAVEESMRLAASLGIGIMLAEFSPIPGTPDGELAVRQTGIDLAEPLWHNKTAFAIRAMGRKPVDAAKSLCRELNSRWKSCQRHSAFPRA